LGDEEELEPEKTAEEIREDELRDNWHDKVDEFCYDLHESGYDHIQDGEVELVGELFEKLRGKLAELEMIADEAATIADKRYRESTYG
jgi:hypothetical protein